jgi:hypothetical protein
MDIQRMSKRKPLSPSRELKAASMEVLRIEDMVLEVALEKQYFYFYRFKYKGVPNLRTLGKKEFVFNTILIDMNRDFFIREIFNLVKDEFTNTSCGYVKKLVVYFRYLDENKLFAINGDYFHPDLTHSCITSLNKLAEKGINETVPGNVRKSLVFFLKKLDRQKEARDLPKNHVKNQSDIRSYDLNLEMKPIAKLLFKGYGAFSKCLKLETYPTIHPFYDEAMLRKVAEEKNLTPLKVAHQKDAFVKSMNSSQNDLFKKDNFSNKRRLCNHLTRCAALICFMLTGMNTNPLLLMRRKDVSIKSVHGDRYIFESVKGRANNQLNDNAIGFSLRTKRFIEEWLELSSFISGSRDNDSWLFPSICADGSVSNFVTERNQLYDPINKLIKYYDLPKLSAQRFRQTKSDTLMKVTESIFLVSLSLNNTIKTVEANYSSGQEKDHQRNLASVMDAKMSIAKGSSVESAVSESKYKFRDVLSEYDYKKLLRPMASTPLGTRCSGEKSVVEQISRQLKSIDVDLPEEERKCTNFLECFECANHALVAMVDDIWLMMSFHDVMMALKENMAINSLPKNKFNHLERVIKGILERFEEKDRSNYQLAKDKHSENPHPLYSDIRSMDDLLEVFG